MEEKLDIMRLNPDAVVKIIKQSGIRNFSMDILDNDIALGFQTNDDGTINLLDYGAWLYKEKYNQRPE